MNDIFILSLIDVLLYMLASWYLSNRKLVSTYITTILAGSVAISVNTLMFYRHEDAYGLLIYNILAGWQIIMAIKGLWGMKRCGPTP